MNNKLSSAIFCAAVEAVVPYAAVKNRSEDLRRRYHDDGFNRLVVVGFGKGAYPMTLAVEDMLGDLLPEGLIVTKYGHSDPSRPLKQIRVVEAGPTCTNVMDVQMMLIV